jgi:hypothetical protein
MESDEDEEDDEDEDEEDDMICWKMIGRWGGREWFGKTDQIMLRPSLINKTKQPNFDDEAGWYWR